MVRAVLLNDTTAWHAGSRAATLELRELLERAGHEIVGTIETQEKPLEAKTRELLHREAPDLVVLHGEGTIHHDAATAVTFLEIASEWKTRGAAVFLVNAVWDGMSARLARLARRFDRVFVREPSSAKILEAEGVEVTGVRLDLSANQAPELEEGLALRPELQGGGYGEGVCGTPLPWQPFTGRPVSLRGKTWGGVVRAIRTCSIYVTGEHHGVIAAALAGVPWAAMEPNTHKLSGLLAWGYGSEIPIARDGRELAAAVDWALTPHGRRVQDRFGDWLREKAPRLSADELEI